MYQLKIRSIAAPLLLLCSGTLLGSSCVEIHINGTCDVREDCYTLENFSGNGAECIEGYCKCPIEGEEPCCPDGGRSCKDALYDCKPREVCAAGVLGIDLSEDIPISQHECEIDNDCDGPPEPRCGTARCADGRCELKITIGKSLDSQYPGDCKRTVCSLEGDLWVWEDPSDLPLDGNPCTYDFCEGGTPLNVDFPNKAPCPGEDTGFCVFGRCSECSDALGIACSMPGMVCVNEQCVPETCRDLVQGPPETALDCGGPECLPCGPDYPCNVDSDCASHVCDPDTLMCRKSTHSDGVKNDSETGVDCGHPDGPPYQCKDGEGCQASIDCLSRVCYLGVCQVPTCLDAVQNGSETGKDCGGDACPVCPE